MADETAGVIEDVDPETGEAIWVNPGEDEQPEGGDKHEGQDDAFVTEVPWAELTPGLTDDEIKSLRETAEILRDDFDVESLKTTAEDRKKLEFCKAVEYKDAHNRSIIKTNWHVEDRLQAASDVLLVENLKKLTPPKLK